MKISKLAGSYRHPQYKLRQLSYTARNIPQHPPRMVRRWRMRTSSFPSLDPCTYWSAVQTNQTERLAHFIPFLCCLQLFFRFRLVIEHSSSTEIMLGVSHDCIVVSVNGMIVVVIVLTSQYPRQPALYRILPCGEMSNHLVPYTLLALRGLAAVHLLVTTVITGVNNKRLHYTFRKR